MRARRPVRPTRRFHPVRLGIEFLERRDVASETFSVLSANLGPAAAIAAVGPASVDMTVAEPAATRKRAADRPELHAPVHFRAVPRDQGAPAATTADRGGVWVGGDPAGGFGMGLFDDLMANVPPPQGPVILAPLADLPPLGGGGDGGAAFFQSSAGVSAAAGTTAAAPPAALEGATAPARSAAQTAGGTTTGGATPARTTGSFASPFPWAQPSADQVSVSPEIDTDAGLVLEAASLTYPSYVLDVNKGAVLSEVVVNHDFAEWAADLRAQVSGATVQGYQWDFSFAPDVLNVTGDTSYRVQFQWASFLGAARDNTVTLTTTFAGGEQQTQTFVFRVAATDSPAWTAAPPTTASTWPAVVTPDMLQADAAVVAGPHHEVSLVDGSVTTAVELPAYNPGVAPLRLVYNSQAADPKPIFLVRHEIDPTRPVPSLLSARVTVNGTPGSWVSFTTMYAGQEMNPVPLPKTLAA
jgi:hypothetical protein